MRAIEIVFEGQKNLSPMALVDLLVENPVIAALRAEEHLENIVACKAQVVFLLSGNICNIEQVVARLHGVGKTVFIHVDLIEGLRCDASGMDFIAKKVAPTGIISTRPTIIRLAHQAGLRTIQRAFMLDTVALKTSLQNTVSCQPDLIEILPGICPEIIDMVRRQTKTPIIAGGFFHNKKNLIAALKAGALAVSTSDKALWAEG